MPYKPTNIGKIVIVFFLLVWAIIAVAAPADDFLIEIQLTGTTDISFPFTDGPYDVDWENDGNFDATNQTGTISHDYGATGAYTVRVRGSFGTIFFSTIDAVKLIDLKQWGSQPWTSTIGLFENATNLVISAIDIPDLSNVTHMSGMFRNAFNANPDTTNWVISNVTNLNSMFFNASIANPNTSNWDTSKVTNLSHMFHGASNANPDTSNWDTSAATDMSYMFFDATSADPNVTGWTTSAVTNMAFMFKGATDADPDVSMWDTSSVINMSNMFEFAVNAVPDISSWNTANVTTMASMFNGASNAQPEPDNWNTAKVTNMNSMFRDTYYAEPDTSGWETSAVTDMAYMFYNADSANPDVSNWDTSAVTNMSNVFSQTAIADPDVSNWDTSAVTNMRGLFSYTSAANPDVSNWDTSAVTNMSYMFRSATAGSLGVSNWDTSLVTNMESMFRFANATPDISNWSIASLNNALDMFKDNALPDDLYDLLLINWESQNPGTNILFGVGSSSFCSLAAANARARLINTYNWTIDDAFNFPACNNADKFITTWDTTKTGTSNNTSITIPLSGGNYDVDWNNDGLFDEFGLSGSVTHDFGSPGIHTIRIRGNYSAIAFNNGGDALKIISVDQWGTNPWLFMNNAFAGAKNLVINARDVPDLSNASSLSSMFYNTDLANPDTRFWDTSSVSDMSAMFRFATAANPDVSRWDTSSVADMSYMFASTDIANPDVSNWGMGNVFDISSMFAFATGFNRDLSNWNISNITGMLQTFRESGLSTSNYDKLLVSWEAQAHQSNVSFGAETNYYCSDAAANAHEELSSWSNWTISDRGRNPNCVSCSGTNKIIFVGFPEGIFTCQGSNFIRTSTSGITLEPGAVVRFQSPAVTLNAGFSVMSGAVFTSSTTIEDAPPYIQGPEQISATIGDTVDFNITHECLDYEDGSLTITPANSGVLAGPAGSELFNLGCTDSNGGVASKAVEIIKN